MLRPINVFDRSSVLRSVVGNHATEFVGYIHRQVQAVGSIAVMLTAREGQTNSRKFLASLEEVLTSSRTSPVVRDRLIEVLGAASFMYPPRGAPSSGGGFAVAVEY